MNSSFTLRDRLFFIIWIVYYFYMMLNSIAFAKGSLIAVAMHAVLLIYLCYYNFIRNDLSNKFFFIYVYLIGLAILIILSSSNMFYSFRNLIKFSEELLCLSVGFALFRNRDNIDRMLWLLKMMVYMFILNFLLSNLLHFGGSMYVDVEGGETGNIEDEGHYLCACCYAFLPILLKYQKRFSLILVFACIFTFVLIVSTMKRASIACALVPILVYAFYYSRKYIYRQGRIGVSAKSFFVFLIAIISFSYILYSFQGMIEARYEARLNRFNAGLENEGRTREFKYIFNDIFLESDIKTMFVGKETFNTVGTYANGRFGKRMIHENYGIMLNGTGVVGLVVYIYINLYIIFIFFKFKKRSDIDENEDAQMLSVTFVCLWIMFLIASFSGTIWNNFYSSIHYASSGLILRYFYEHGETFNADYSE